VKGSTGDGLAWKSSTYADTTLNIQHVSLRRQNEEVTPDLLILLVTQDSDSWGIMPDGTPRSFASLLTLLHEVSIDLTRTSLGILTSSQAEFDLYRSLSMKEPFARVSIIFHPGYLGPADAINRADRHYNHVQHKRRNQISRLRNYLMLHALEREEHIVWIDADVYKFTSGLIPAMVRHSANPEVGVLTVLSHHGEREDSDFDLNCWVGPRTSPNEEEKARLLEDVSTWVASPAPGNRGMGELVRSHGNDSDLFRLDAVGGTLLYIRASLVRQGLSWAYSYIVGTSWAGEGWDAIESESLCILARPLGADCYGMGGRWRSHHSPV
jgi:mannan polymerase complexes MNN9 subunit